MRKKNSRLSIIVVFLLLSILILGPAHLACAAGKIKNIALGTASSGGSWYPIGTGIASILNSKIEGIKVTAQSTMGAPENIDMIRNGEMQFGLCYPMVSTPAWKGIMAFKGKQYQGMRTIMALFENVQSPVVLKKYVKTGNVEDLNGLKFNVGPPGSGTALEWELVKKTLNLTFKEEFLTFGQGADALKNGTIGGASLNAAIPHHTIVQLIAEGVPIQILSFTKEQFEKITAELDYCYLTEIPAGTYKGQDSAIPMTAQSTFLFTAKEIDEELVYKVTKALCENTDELRKVHGSLNKFSIEKALAGLKQPLHKGAIKYYKERGIQIPDSLMPPEAK